MVNGRTLEIVKEFVYLGKNLNADITRRRYETVISRLWKFQYLRNLIFNHQFSFMSVIHGHSQKKANIETLAKTPRKMEREMLEIRFKWSFAIHTIRQKDYGWNVAI